MPTLNSKKSLTKAAKEHFSRNCGDYVFGTIISVLVGGAATLGVSMINQAEEHEKQRAVEVQAHKETEKTFRERMMDAFRQGQKKITDDAGVAYGLLSGTNSKGDIVVTAHKATNLSPAGEILSIEPEPRFRAEMPAPLPAPPAGPR